MKKTEPLLWLVAGPNGAGKTTVAQSLSYTLGLHLLRSLNPDNVSKELLQQRGNYTFASAPDDMLRSTFLEAASSVFERSKTAVESGEAICLETVLSTDKYRELVQIVLKRGGFFGLIYVAVSSTAISARRIAARVRLGGHDVPSNKLVSRWQRSLEQLPWFVNRAQVAFIYDNSNENPGLPPTLLAHKRNGTLEIIRPDLIPELTHALSQTLPSI